MAAQEVSTLTLHGLRMGAGIPSEGVHALVQVYGDQFLKQGEMVNSNDYLVPGDGLNLPNSLCTAL